MVPLCLILSIAPLKMVSLIDKVEKHAAFLLANNPYALIVCLSMLWQDVSNALCIGASKTTFPGFLRFY
jgi:hypothetical protein